LLADDLDEGGRAEVELVEEEVVGWAASSPSGRSAVAGKSFTLAVMHALRAALGRCRDDVPVIGGG
jgi:hypothetical protein